MAENSILPCMVINVGEEKFTVKFFEEDVDIHGMFFKGDRLKLGLSFDRLDYKENTVQYWKNDGCVKPATRVEILDKFVSRVKIAEDNVKTAEKKLREAKEGVVEAEKLLEQVRADIQGVEVIHQFELDGIKLEAVRVHQENEKSLLGEEAIRRANVGGVVISSEEDWKRVYNNRDNFPPELDKRWLATARPSSDSSRGVSWLGHSDHGWFEDGNNDLGVNWGSYALILRRRA